MKSDFNKTNTIINPGNALVSPGLRACSVLKTIASSFSLNLYVTLFWSVYHLHFNKCVVHNYVRFILVCALWYLIFFSFVKGGLALVLAFLARWLTLMYTCPLNLYREKVAVSSLTAKAFPSKCMAQCNYFPNYTRIHVITYTSHT